jgi:nucleotide-binding universal stress UspA family protein
MEKTILVPYDGSPSSNQAVEFAITLVKEEDTIILINVQKPQYEGIGKVGNVSKEQLDDYYQKLGRRMLNEAKESFPKSKIKIDTLTRIGLPSIEITKAAKEFSVHSIVMGSKGMSPVVSNALGSVTYSVIHLAPCPVTIVPYTD